MKTLEEIKAKCEIIPHDAQHSRQEHWIWTGATLNKPGGAQPVCRAPDFTKDPTGATMTSQSVRRAIKHITTGKPIRSKLMGFRFCTDPLCVSPDCTRWMYRKQAGKEMSKLGMFDSQSERRSVARTAAWQRSRATPVTVEMIDTIRNERHRPIKDVAADLGIGESTVRTYRATRSMASAPNPFRGLFQGLLRA